MSNFTEDDMIFTKNEKIISGGYEINSHFLNNNIPVTYSLNGETMFGGLVVPSGLLYLTPHSKLTTELEPLEMSGGGEPATINDNLYNKLFTLAQIGGMYTTKISKKTRCKKKRSTNLTRKL